MAILGVTNSPNFDAILCWLFHHVLMEWTTAYEWSELLIHCDASLYFEVSHLQNDFLHSRIRPSGNLNAVDSANRPFFVGDEYHCIDPFFDISAFVDEEKAPSLDSSLDESVLLGGWTSDDNSGESSVSEISSSISEYSLEGRISSLVDDLSDM
ncbi:hypothetical protein T03_3650 [Trichinella britovi]|uniref:Uncharacterized protein n=1 Tax=Trichinella britovi TaxID=45882 RepID=A0A0V1CI89_TRIBR|nr:hypothetical protein T03_3650 [Trichinella britovi]